MVLHISHLSLGLVSKAETQFGLTLDGFGRWALGVVEYNATRALRPGFRSGIPV